MKAIDKKVNLVPNQSAPWEQVQLSISRYVSAASLIKDRVVLDVGCGTGYGSCYLRNKGARMVIGGDISQPVIAYAQSRYKKEGVQFILLDATKLPFANGSFDTIVSMEVIEHISEYENFVNECKRVLKDSGTFICSTPNKEVCSPGQTKPVHRPHVQEFSVTEFKSLLERYFKDILIYGLGNESKKMVVMRRLKLKVESFLRSEKIIRLIDSVLNFVLCLLPRYRYVKFDATPESNFETALDERYNPQLLQGVARDLYLATIAVSKVRK